MDGIAIAAPAVETDRRSGDHRGRASPEQAARARLVRYLAALGMTEAGAVVRTIDRALEEALTAGAKQDLAPCALRAVERMMDAAALRLLRLLGEPEHGTAVTRARAGLIAGQVLRDHPLLLLGEVREEDAAAALAEALIDPTPAPRRAPMSVQSLERGLLRPAVRPRPWLWPAAARGDA